MPADIDKDPLILLHMVGRLLRNYIDKRARDFDMTRAQWIILMYVSRTPGLTQQELANILEVEAITIGRLIDKLEQRSLIERRRDPKDRRVWRLHNLPASNDTILAINQIRKDLLTDIQNKLGDSKITVLIDALLSIKEHMIQERGICDCQIEHSKE
ncbi:MarR family transcriptional regulator [Microvirga sp. W0021]|uniref:MarR family transcriptional regulator n=1 Tax=Hohaiivirga grylli TaxID=3133970 RepID=A0ABV0BGA5_9HYPH